MTEKFPDVPLKETVIVENEIGFSVDDESMEWEEEIQDERFNLPEGAMAKVLNEDERTSRIDILAKFPAGYVEPRHSHEAGHAAMIVDGPMLIHEHELTSGDYVYGQKEEHGPMEYPEGCMVFASFIGGSAKHEWNED